MPFDLMQKSPITGNGLIDATIPGKWAAPPAPAMITLHQSVKLFSQNWSFSQEFDGRRRYRLGISNSLSASIAACMVGNRFTSHTIPTRYYFVIIDLFFMCMFFLASPKSASWTMVTRSHFSEWSSFLFSINMA